MAYRYGERRQEIMFPASIEEYVNADDPVRVYDAFIDSLDLREVGINYKESRLGNAEYDPKAMLKLLVYSYSYGCQSSRKIERALYHNVSFMWLMGGLRPDHKTIARFRKEHKESLKRVLKQCVRLCMRLDLIEGNILFVDGTKIRANAGRGKNHSKRHYEEELRRVDQRIDKIVGESERIDNEESGEESLVKMKKDLASSEKLREEIREVLEEFKAVEERGRERETINQTDRESGIMRSVQGSHASYNVQSVVDDKHGLIVNVDAVKEATDINQFADQIIKAEEMTGKECESGVADAGYADTKELEKIDERGTKVIVPSQRQALHKEEGEFSKSKFRYNSTEDCYYCPEGKRLDYRGINERDEKLQYKIANGEICKACKQYGICTKSEHGRVIVRLVKEEVREKLEKQYKEVESQEIYKRRKMRVEHPFGHIKQNLGIRNFLLRGKRGAEAEISIAAVCFNLVRMITIYGGVSQLITRLRLLEG